MKVKLHELIASLLIVIPFSGMADVKPAVLFADGMVIQRETKAPVWGTAEAGEKVSVTGSWGETAAVTAGEKGKWMVKLQTPSAGGPHSLTIKGYNTVEIKDVLSGEVWFCSGQSNMAFELKMLAKTNNHRTENRYKPAAAYVKQEMETARDEMLRQFTVTGNTSPLVPLETLSGQWMSSSPQTNPEFSGTAYFFGREIRKELDVPVGLILCAWGATRVEPWIPAEAYQQDEEMALYYQNNMMQEEEEKAEREATRRGWRPTVPSTIFNGIVNPVIPYAIKGAIWYQGEANSDHNPHRYERNFRAMISSWRAHWGQGDFPFYFAQLANYAKPAPGTLGFDGWPTVCDQQRRTLGLKNTGMAVLHDIGEARDVHPHNKMDVGKRLALWALKNDYKQNIPVCSGPLYKSHEIKGDKVIIKFDSAGSGLMTGEKPVMEATRETKTTLKHFQVCGAARQWKSAQAEISGKDTVTVSHPEVPKPVAVRYAWAPNPEGANLYNKEGLPASTFTTGTEIQATASSSVSVGESPSTYNIEDYGAVADGKTLCTTAIQKAIDSCNQAGGGKVVIPAGKFLTGTLVLKSNVELHLQKDAVLLGSFDLKDYPVKLVKYRSYTDRYTDKSLIFAEEQENISITGSGMINFQGEKFPPSPKRNWYKTTPFGIRVTSCKNVRVTGVTLRNSAMWMQLYLNCDGVHIEGITVWNHARRCNDGIDIDSTRNVKILNCKIDALDDGICMKSTGPDPTENVLVSGCVVSSRCNALKTGTESTGGFKNIRFTHCKIVPSKGEMHVRGHQEKGIGGVCIGAVDGGVCENITVDNITIEGALAPLFVRLGKRNRRYHPDVEILKDGTMKNISFSNITVTGGTHNYGCAFLGLPGNPIKGLKLSNITIESPGGGTKKEGEIVVAEKAGAYPQATYWGKLPAYGFFVRNADDVEIKNVHFTTIQKDERPAFVLEEVHGSIFRNIETKSVTGTPLVTIRENCTDIDLGGKK